MKLLLLLFISISALANSDSDYTFDSIAMTGSGCERGSAAVVKDPSSQSISILFDRFSAEVPNYESSNIKLNQKRCYIEVAGKIPMYEKITSLEVVIDFRGTTIAEPGTQVRFDSKLHQWKGSHLRPVRQAQILEQKLWNSGSDDLWTISKQISIPVHSDCSGRHTRGFKFALNNLLEAKIQSNVAPEGAFALGVMDSADVGPQMKVIMKTKKCGNAGRGNVGNGRGNGRGHGSERGNGRGNGRWK